MKALVGVEGGGEGDGLAVLIEEELEGVLGNLRRWMGTVRGCEEYWDGEVG